MHRDVYLEPGGLRPGDGALVRNTWIYVGHDSQIPQAGDYLHIDIADHPVIMLRDNDGSVRVLMNRCAHKGAQLGRSACGNTGKFFRCPYHAWTFRWTARCWTSR